MKGRTGGKKGTKTPPTENATASNNSNSGEPPDIFAIQERVNKLEQITGLSRSEANELLEKCQNDLQKAINSHFNDTSSTASAETKKQSTSTTTNRQKRPLETTTDETLNTNSNNGFYTDDDDNVRAPIPQKIERMINYDPYAMQSKRSRTNFDVFRKDSTNSNGTDKLGKLFTPPIKMLYQGSFETVGYFDFNFIII
jgi:hypothetical protein